jgi:hypothetical protein
MRLTSLLLMPPRPAAGRVSVCEGGMAVSVAGKREAAR